MNWLIEKATRAIASKRWTLACVAVALLLCMPALRMGFFTDDWVLLGELEGSWPSPSGWDLYSFSSGEPSQVRELKALGAFPWWSSDELKLRLLRPLSSLLLNAEHLLFGRDPLGYHVVSLAVFACLLLVAGALLRRALPAALAGLALAVFAWSDLQAQPAGWIANRHSALGALFGFLGVLQHLSWRERGRAWGGLASLAFSALGLACSEVGLQPLAYVLAYELLGAPDRGAGLAPRWRAVAAPAALALGYVASYRALGFGAGDSAAYLDPFAVPGAFLIALLERLPAFAADLLAAFPLDLWLFAPGARGVLVGLGVFSLLVFAWALSKARQAMPEQERRALRWLLAGAVLSAMPAASGAPGSRLLLVPALGAAAGVAVVLLRLPAGIRAAESSRPERVAAAGLIVILAPLHLLWHPLLLVGQLRFLGESVRRAAQVASSAEAPAAGGARILLLGVPDPQYGYYVGFPELARAPRKVAAWRTLTMADCEHQIARVAANALEVRLVGCELLEREWERLFRPPGQPLAPGDRLEAGEMLVEVLEAGRGPAKLRFTFDRPVDDPKLVFLTWRDQGLHRVGMPQVGGSLTLRPD